MVELAIILPVLMTLFLGSWTAADLVADNNVAAQASRAGARYGAELADNDYTTTGLTSPTSTDTEIINQMMPILTGKLINATLTEIDIYQPGDCLNGGSYAAGTCPPPANGSAYVTGDPVDTYLITNGTTVGTCAPCTFTLDQRSPIHPGEAEMGVRVVFAYTSPTLRFFTQTNSQYTVIRMATVQ